MMTKTSMFLRPAVLCAFALLAGCETPPQPCEPAHTRDIATLDRLIAETEGNLARGYARSRSAPQSGGFDFCLGGGGHNVGVSFCSPGGGRTVTTGPVAIDPAAERRKLAQLVERRDALAADDARRVAACSGRA